MSDFIFSEHAHDMLIERKINRNWVDSAIKDPDKKEKRSDGTLHYIKQIKEYNNRYLRVIINPNVKPMRIITLYFDRRLRK